MLKLFIYATLRSHRTFKSVVGHLDPESKAVLPGYEEVYIREDGQNWPTIVPGSGFVRGEIVQVDEKDLAKLDNWENNYIRIKARTSGGEAYVYCFKWHKTGKAA